MAAAARSTPPPAGPDGTPPFICGMQFGPGRVRFGGYPLSLFANGLSNQVGRAVVDRTGLPGSWAFELAFAPITPGPEPIDSDAANLFTAVQEQLGLKLDSTKGPVDVLVLDRVQRPTPD